MLRCPALCWYPHYLVRNNEQITQQKQKTDVTDELCKHLKTQSSMSEIDKYTILLNTLWFMDNIEPNPFTDNYIHLDAFENMYNRCREYLPRPSFQYIIYNTTIASTGVVASINIADAAYKFLALYAQHRSMSKIDDTNITDLANSCVIIAATHHNIATTNLVNNEDLIQDIYTLQQHYPMPDITSSTTPQQRH